MDVRGRCATRDAGVARVGRPGREWRLLAPGIVRATLRHYASDSAGPRADAACLAAISPDLAGGSLLA